MRRKIKRNEETWRMKNFYPVKKIELLGIKTSCYENLLGFFALLFPIVCTAAALYFSPVVARIFKTELTANFKFVFMLSIFFVSCVSVFVISRKIKFPVNLLENKTKK